MAKLYTGGIIVLNEHLGLGGCSCNEVFHLQHVVGGCCIAAGFISALSHWKLKHIGVSFMPSVFFCCAAQQSLAVVSHESWWCSVSSLLLIERDGTGAGWPRPEVRERPER